MATIRQKKALKNLGKSRTEAKDLVKAGYSPSYARSGQIKRTKAFKDLLEKHLPDSLLLQKHKDLINKTEIVRKFDHELGQFIEDDTNQPDTQAVSKGLDMAYKLKGAYAPEKSVNLNIDVEADEITKEAAQKLNALYRGTSGASDGALPDAVGDKTQDQE